MKYEFTKHAIGRMRERGIAKSVAKAVLELGSRNKDYDNPNIEYVKTLGFTAVVDEWTRTVITIYRTQKPTLKYRRRLMGPRRMSAIQRKLARYELAMNAT